jgi:hypothetical protein
MKTCRKGLHQYPSEKKRCPGCKETYNKVYFSKPEGKAAHKKYRAKPEAKAARAAYYGAYQKRRRLSDPNFRTATCLRANLTKALSGKTKTGSAVKALGCTLDQFKAYLEAQFWKGENVQPSMTWENQGKNGWHLDHIKPLASFDLTDPQQFSRAFHYTNYQPLWERHNISKKDSSMIEFVSTQFYTYLKQLEKGRDY